MERNRVAHEYQDLKQALSNERMPEIDVTCQVMRRISLIEGRRHSVLKKTTRSTVAMGGMLALILLISVSAYAASEYIQLITRDGVVKVQHVASDEPATGTANVYDYSAAQVQDFAKPGELIAFFVKSDRISEITELGLRFEYKEQQITSYSDFLKEIKRTGAPNLPLTAMGYSFEYGKINPKFPTIDVQKKDSYYQKVYSDLRVQAAKSSSGQKVFMKTVPWSEPLSISGIYSKGKAHIGISVILMNGGNMVVEQEKENSTDKILVAGTEVVYNNMKKNAVSYHYLNWYNEEQDAYYTLSSFGDKELTKAQFLQLAGELLRKGTS
ncbi:hypothetical protein PTQ21_23055 [Paenibacillus marchantiae]|uniref:hypothetical protein n=1 Tax=Paenibacillus TaxID=44249 RepID=UPI0022A9557E|nr:MULTISPECIES: hypothetical protein [Paenibacillus]MCZ1268710.1 hypothetical protein [Paenibacillus tundrae]WDQ31267.1 hypothetical protein PTQ21_23055 [Paenibacillus marchantiae]